MEAFSLERREKTYIQLIEGKNFCSSCQFVAEYQVPVNHILVEKELREQEGFLMFSL